MMALDRCYSDYWIHHPYHITWYTTYNHTRRHWAINSQWEHHWHFQWDSWHFSNYQHLPCDCSAGVNKVYIYMWLCWWMMDNTTTKSLFPSFFYSRRPIILQKNNQRKPVHILKCSEKESKARCKYFSDAVKLMKPRSSFGVKPIQLLFCSACLEQLCDAFSFL